MLNCTDKCLFLIFKGCLSDTVNSCVGISLNRYVNFARLDRYMLLEKQGGEQSVTDRILEAGFPSLATFYRAKKERESLG